MQQETIDYYTKLYISRQSFSDYSILNPNLSIVFMEGEIWANIKDLGNHKVRYKLGLIPEFPKCVANDLCKPKWSYLV